MTDEFRTLFADENAPRLTRTTESIHLISPNVALERGAATVNHGDAEVFESEYSVVYVKAGDTWLINRVTEEEIVDSFSHYEQLRELEWLVGEWIDEGAEVSVEYFVSGQSEVDPGVRTSDYEYFEVL